MKTDIEKLIQDNLHKFEAAELPEGYLHRFEKKLNKPRRRMWVFTAFATAAAAAVAILLIVLQTPEQQVPDIYKEMAEIETYYQGRHQKTMEIIEKLLEKADPATRATIDSELVAMQAEDAEFRYERCEIVGNEHYLAFEVQYYNTRQQSLEYIQTLLSK